MSGSDGGRGTELGNSEANPVSFSSIIPGWLSDNLTTLKNLVTDPRKTILGIVVTWLVSGILGVGEALVGSVNAVYASLTGALGIGVDQLGTAGSVLLTAPTIILETTGTAIQSVASAAGPFAPLVITLLWGGIVTIIILALRELPAVLWYIYQVIPGT